jgi:hypothetical protein
VGLHPRGRDGRAIHPFHGYGRPRRDGGRCFPRYRSQLTSAVFSPSYPAALPISLRLLTSPHRRRVTVMQPFDGVQGVETSCHRRETANGPPPARPRAAIFAHPTSTSCVYLTTGLYVALPDLCFRITVRACRPWTNYCSLYYYVYSHTV